MAHSAIRDVDLQLKLEANDRMAWNKFVPRPLGAEVIVVRASERPANPFDDEYLGWKAYVKGNIEAYEANGNHDTIYTGTSIRLIAEKINARLRPAPKAKHPLAASREKSAGRPGQATETLKEK